MLAGVADQQNTVVRVQAAYKLVHLFGDASELSSIT